MSRVKAIEDKIESDSRSIEREPENPLFYTVRARSYLELVKYTSDANKILKYKHTAKDDYEAAVINDRKNPDAQRDKTFLADYAKLSAELGDFDKVAALILEAQKLPKSEFLVEYECNNIFGNLLKNELVLTKLDELNNDADSHVKATGEHFEADA